MSFKFISSDDLAGSELTQGLFVQKGLFLAFAFLKPLKNLSVSPFPNLSLVLLQAKQAPHFPNCFFCDGVQNISAEGI